MEAERLDWTESSEHGRIMPDLFMTLVGAYVPNLVYRRSPVSG